MNNQAIEVIAEMYEALKVMVDVFPTRGGEPGCDMHVETLAHEKAGAAMNKAEIFNHAFWMIKASSPVTRFYPGIDDSGTIPRAIAVETLTGDYVHYDDLYLAITDLCTAIDTLYGVIGLTPVLGNKETLQEAMDFARAIQKRYQSCDSDSIQAASVRLMKELSKPNNGL